MPGTTTIHAMTNVTVAGIVLTRATGDGQPGDGPDASATWLSVQQQLATLSSQVNGVAPGSSLAAKVKVIQGYVAANDKADACNALGAFINQVNAQKSKKTITPAQAASFIAQAQAIEAGLGC
jgi:hypothetical protein